MSARLIAGGGTCALTQPPIGLGVQGEDLIRIAVRVIGGHRRIVAAGDGHGDIVRGAVQARDLKGLGQRFGHRKRLDRRLGVVRGVAPVTVGGEIQGTVGACQGDGGETGFTAVGVADGQAARGSDVVGIHGHVFLQRAAIGAGNHCRVVDRGNRNGGMTGGLERAASPLGAGVAIIEDPVDAHGGGWGVTAIGVAERLQGLVDECLGGIVVECQGQGAGAVAGDGADHRTRQCQVATFGERGQVAGGREKVFRAGPAVTKKGQHRAGKIIRRAQFLIEDLDIGIHDDGSPTFGEAGGPVE